MNKIHLIKHNTLYLFYTYFKQCRLLCKLVQQKANYFCNSNTKNEKLSFTCRTTTRLQKQLCNALQEIVPEMVYFPFRKYTCAELRKITSQQMCDIPFIIFTSPCFQMWILVVVTDKFGKTEQSKCLGPAVFIIKHLYLVQ